MGSGNKRGHACPVIIWLVLLCVALVLPRAVQAREQVTLHLNWTHSFQFAGYYMAEALGYYNDANLSVVIEEGRPDHDVIGRVVSGAGHYGVSVSNLLLARAAGKPVVALAVINQHSPFVLIAREDSSTQSIHDLVGKRVMLQADGDEILAYLRREGIDPERLQRVEHSFDIGDLVEGRVDAMTGYVTNEPALLDALGIRYHLYSPRSAGIDFYADNLFTSEAELEAHPERVRAFRAASLRGWKYAMEHPQEAIALLLQRYPRANTREQLEYEARTLAPLILADVVEVGYMNPGRWQHIADVYAESGVLPRGFSLDGFLYDPNPRVDLGWMYAAIGGVLAAAALVGGIAAYIFRLNRQLGQSLEKERQAKERLQVLSLAVEQSPTSIVITGPDARIQYVNPHFTRTTGYGLEEVCGKNPRILSAGDTTPALYREMWASLARGETWSGEFHNRRRSGEPYAEEAHVAPVRNAQGEVSHYVAVKLDITERKRQEAALARAQAETAAANEALARANAELTEHRDHLEVLVQARTRDLAAARDAAESANRAKGLILANLSHELRTPLNHIIGFNGLLKTEVSGEQGSKWLSLVERSAWDLLRLVDRLLDTARVEADALEINEAVFNLPVLLAGVEDAARLALRQKGGEPGGLALRFEVAPELPTWVCGDATRLSQVFRELIDNAAKFSDSGCIEVSVSPLKAGPELVTLRFEVADQGVGVPLHAQEEMFALFSQADASSTRRHGGVGLGLALCRRLVALMAGEIGYRPRPAGGSVFWIDVPLSKVDGGAHFLADEPTPDAQPARLEELRERLRENAFEVVDLWRAIGAEMKPLLGDSHAEVEDAILNFDFGRAEAIIARTRLTD